MDKQIEQNNIELSNIVIIMGMITVLILFGTHSTIFSLGAFAICSYLLIMGDGENGLIMMIYLMSFAHIFKISSEGMSYFTFLMIIYVVIGMMKTGKLPIWGLLLGFYIIFIQCIYRNIDIKADIKLIGNVFFLFYAFYESKYYSKKRIFLSYIIGVIIAAAMRFLDSSFFNITAYAGATEIEIFGANATIKSIERFMGIYSDPNYLGVNLILSLCILVVLFNRQEISLHLMTCLAIPILNFCVLTKSKSVLLMMIFPVFLFLYTNHQKQKYMLQFMVVAGGISIIIAFAMGELHFLDAVFQRIEEAGSGGLSKLTTGRIDVWAEYITFFLRHPVKLLFGVGIGNVGSEHCAHNFYLESLRYIGVIGSGIFYFSVRESFNNGQRNISRSIVNYSALICILVMYVFLNQLHDYEFPIHFLLAFVVWNSGNVDLLDNSCP